MIKLSYTSQAEPKQTQDALLHPVNVCGGGYLLDYHHPLRIDGHDKHSYAGSLSNDRCVDRILKLKSVVKLGYYSPSQNGVIVSKHGCSPCLCGGGKGHDTDVPKILINY